MDISKRIGKINLDIIDVRKSDEKVLKAMFSKFYPLSIRDKHDYVGSYSSDFIGLSPDFEEVEKGGLVPSYFMFIDMDNYEVEFIKEK